MSTKRKSKLNSDAISLRQRLFVLINLITIIILSVTLIEVSFTNRNLMDVMMLAALILFNLLVAIVSVRTGKIGLGSGIICFVMAFGKFPVTFINGGGISGDAPLWFIYNILLISILLRDKVKIIYLVLEVLTGAVCYYISLAHPEMIRQNDHIMAHVYSYASLVMIGIAVSAMISLEIRLFMKEKKRSDEQKKEIEALNASQNQFFSSMSHEIRTPINTIIGLNEMILRENISDEVIEDAVNIRSAGKLLLNLINDILDMSKFQSGKMRLSIGPYQTGNMLSDLVGMLWIRAKEKKLDFKINVSPDIPSELIGDEVRIKQILINVLNNAIKYTKEGSISLTVQCEKRENDIYNVIYTVTDTGVGIKKEDIPFLFTAFKRVDEDTNSHIEGTGLGLSIVKQFLDLMGGKVTVNSIYTKGSTFIIEIPQKGTSGNLIGEFNFEKTHALGRSGEYRQKFEAPNARILVVDDNESNLMVVSKLLRGTKVIIDTALNGEEALKKTLNVEYNVVFMDHLMPEMDGIECKRRIQNQIGGLNRNTKIVILTANAGEENRELYQKEGFHGYLVKPVSGDELESELYRLLPKDMVNVIGDNEEILDETISWMHGSQQRKAVVITTESVADLPKEIIEQYGIVVLPHKVSTIEGTFKDGIEIDTSGVIAYMQEDNNRVYPVAPDVKEHEVFFAKQLAYANNVVHISISEKIEKSGCPFAMEAAKAFDNVFVVDSGHLSSGQGLLVIEAARMAEEGKSPEEIVEGLERLKNKIHTSFIVDNLDFLAKSGQVGNRIASLVKSLMGRPVLVLKKGKMKVGKIYFGSRKNAWKRYIASVLSSVGKIDNRILFITYVGLTKKDMDWIKEQAMSRMEFEEIYFEQASASVAANCGPGTFGLLLRDKSRSIDE